MSRRIKESHLAAILQRNAISTDMLSDTSGLTGYHVGITDMVKQRGLTVVYVTHSVTIGARPTRSFSSSSSSLTASCTSALTYSVLKPNSSATILMVSASSRWLIDTMIPTLISVEIT